MLFVVQPQIVLISECEKFDPSQSFHFLFLFPSRPDDPLEETLVCAEGRDLHVVPLQAGVPEVRLAVQEGWRPVHPLTQVVVVVTGHSQHAKSNAACSVVLVCWCWC